MITRTFRRRAKGGVAPMRKAKIPIPAAIYRVLRDFCRNSLNFGTALSQKKDLKPEFEFIPRCKKRGIQI
jgi:hypothetical protein